MEFSCIGCQELYIDTGSCWCSEECAKKSAAKEKRRREMLRICIHCGNEFYRRRKDADLCSDLCDFKWHHNEGYGGRYMNFEKFSEKKMLVKKKKKKSRKRRK